MNKTSKSKILFIILPILAIAIHYFLSGILYYGFYSFFVNVLQVTEKKLLNFSNLTEILVNTVLTLFLFIIYRLALKKESNRPESPLNLKISAICLVAGIGTSIICHLWITAIKNVPFFQESLSAMDAANKSIESGSFFELILITVVIAPLIEEILFRGIVFGSMRHIFPVWVSILLSSALFGIYHMNAAQAVYAAFMGIIAAIIYNKTNRLIYPILVHAANNLIGAVLSFFL